jgi:integrator complex subunit 1
LIIFLNNNLKYLGDRSWVDLPLLKPLVENLLVSFGTILPSTTLLPASDGGAGSGGGSSPSQLVINEDSSGSGHFMVDELKQIIQEQNDWSEYSMKNRYASLEINVETIIVDFATEVVQKKSPDIPKNLLKALSSVCGLSGVRTWIVTRVEQWLHNGKLGRVAQELLLHLCVNSNCNTPSDMDVISQVSKLRMKTKPLINFHSIALR